MATLERETELVEQTAKLIHLRRAKFDQCRAHPMQRKHGLLFFGFSCN